MTRGAITRKTPLQRKTPVKRVNKPRKEKNFARAYGGEARVSWICRQPSIISGASPCVNAHVRVGGAGRKADARWVVPLTFAEHAELHTIGQKSFESKYNVDLFWFAQVIDARWGQYQATRTSP